MQDFWLSVLWYFTRVFAAIVYFFPAIVASRYQHPRQPAILFLNILLGWTVIGWIIALRWAWQAHKQTVIEKHP